MLFKAQRFFFLNVILLFFYFSIPPVIFAAETYTQAINNAITNINNVSGSNAFIPDYPNRGNKVMITIQGDPASENSSFGLTYNSNFGDGNNYLVTRTLTNVSYYLYTAGTLRYGVGDYTTYDDGLSHQASWMTTGNDTTKFIDANVTSATSLVTTMEQGLGMDNSAGGTHTAIVEYGVLANNNNLIRPTNLLDIKSYSTNNTDYTYHATFTPVQPSDMSSSAFTFAQTYLQYWQATQLDAGKFPFTELGYTYYWGQASTALNSIQGLSEFIIPGGTAVKIIGIYSPQSYMYTKNKNGAFSSDSDAEYGNGFGGFNVTGSCDTIWAGNAFQKNASSDSSNPNQIILASGQTISGGQGILVWSPNYTITNYGTISGATVNKLKDAAKGNVGMSNTANVALLFLGDTTYGDVVGGKNILINSGSISSATNTTSTAVEVDAGNTEITNSGTISGFTYGVYLKGGTSKITNTGTISTTGGAANSAAIQIDSGTTTVNSTGTITGNVILASNATAAIDVGNTNLALTGKYVQNSSSTLKLTINSATDFGRVSATDANTQVAADSNISITVSGYIPNNTTFTNVISGTGSVNINVPSSLTINSPIFTLSGANGTGDHLNLTATRANSYNSFATSSNSSAVGVVLNTVANSSAASGDITTVLGALDSLTSAQALDSALNSLTPSTDNSCLQAGYQTQSSFISNSVDRINSIFSSSGMYASSGQLDPAIWTQVFDNYMHQGPRGTSNGYNANIWGILGGYDTQVRPDLALGASFGYARNEIRTKDSSAHTQADSYQLGLYGSFTRRSYYLDGIFSFVYNRYDSSRRINFGGLDRTPISKYDGQQYAAYFEGGRSFNYRNLEVIPLASLQYSRLNVGGYTERNADAANLQVDNQGYNLLQSGLGARLALTIKKKILTFIPDFHFKWLYNLINDNQQSSSTFTGGGASFSTSGFNPPTSSYNVGSKLTILAKNNISLVLNYDYQFMPDFYSNSGYVSLRYEF